MTHPEELAQPPTARVVGGVYARGGSLSMCTLWPVQRLRVPCPHGIFPFLNGR